MAKRISAWALVGMVLVLALSTSTASAIAIAPATSTVQVSTNPAYKGWGKVNPNYCAPGRICAMIYFASAKAYWWSGRAWVATNRPTGETVYVWPYGSGWSWTWTAETGWLAMRSSDLTYTATGVAL